MIRLPIISNFKVDEYQLYPAGLDIALKPGLTLILGANGLGKTTLVTMMFRALTGPYDIPRPGMSSVELGGRKLDSREMSRSEARTFASRVADEAQLSRFDVQYELGDFRVNVKRDTSNLRLLSFSVDGVEVSATEAEYQAWVVSKTGLASFGDWVLALRHLVFYFEDRQALIWDPSAQRQLLRLLFLPVSDSREWTKQERVILELDSLVRNLRYALNKEEKLAGKIERAASNQADVSRRIKELHSEQSQESELLQTAEDELAEAAAVRAEARLRALQAEQGLSEAGAAVERLELLAIDAAFPSASETSRYLLMHILSDDHCLTCGSDVPDFRAVLQARLQNDDCVTCGSPVSRTRNEHAHHPRGLAKARNDAAKLEQQTNSAIDERANAEAEYGSVLMRVSQLTASTSRRAVEIEELAKQLPPDASQLVEQTTTLERMRSSLAVRTAELTRLRSEFRSFVDGVNSQIASQKEAIKAAFESYATGFLVEDCDLFWQPRLSRVGQTGEQVEFAAFELRLTGGSLSGPTLRTGPAQVSESQREFIDLSFRMALIEVATSGGTLVIDAPESSLDAVFVERAAKVLTAFAAIGNNRLVVTSNLVDGDLIPNLLAKSGVETERDDRIVDLFKLAAPTAATLALRVEYAAARKRVFDRTREIG